MFMFPTKAVEVIAHNEVSQHSLTTSQLRRIYTMRQLYWADDNAITVFVLPSKHELHKTFSKERLQIFPYQLNRIWHKLTYSGLGVAPVIVNSPEELILAVMRTPGAIGYVDKALLEQTLLAFNSQEQTEQQRSSEEGGLHVVTIED